MMKTVQFPVRMRGHAYLRMKKKFSFESFYFRDYISISFLKPVVHSVLPKHIYEVS